MEKRKVFKISIIDKEISRTEFDRNTFYTSDSELTLVFKLIERDYSYDHGEILLYNKDDKSFVTRKIKKQENDFVYELDSDIIPHYGTWKAQLQLVNDGNVYTSKPFEFNIVNDLSNLAPQPTLTDISNWTILKQTANELIDEMQDVIVSVEKSELERVNKENLRIQAESGRVNSEFKRDNKETERKQAELERENNETTRQQAETEREREENTRQQAESSRISAEAQRKIDHANRSTELAGKANKKQEDWITPTLLNGASGTVQYRKNEFGRVEFRGNLTATDGFSAFTLPSGYRPPVNTLLVGVSSSAVNDVTVFKIFIVFSGGSFNPFRPYVQNNTFIYDLSGLSFVVGG